MTLLAPTTWAPAGTWHTDEDGHRWYHCPTGGVWTMYYASYAHSFGREPREQIAHDTYMHWFTMWLGVAWAEWARTTGRRLRDHRTSQDHRLFTAWLPDHARAVTTLARLKGKVRR